MQQPEKRPRKEGKGEGGEVKSNGEKSSGEGRQRRVDKHTLERHR